MKVLVALGGNAILQRGERGTAEQELGNVRATARHLARIVARGERIALTHGNGPQVGEILLQNEMTKDAFPPMPLDVCGAETQGMLGYMLQQSLEAELRLIGKYSPVVTVVSQTLVDPADPAFANPTKPVGPFYSKEEAARIGSGRGWKLVEDSGRGYRRVVPSPQPVEIVEKDVVTKLFDSGVIVVSSGGGGIPVVRRADGTLSGVEAVLDKDRTASLLATTLGVDALLMLTDVPAVYLDYGRTSARAVSAMSADEAEGYLASGQFPEGSMGPKVESAIRFVRRGGSKAVISSLENAERALAGESGTTISISGG